MREIVLDTETTGFDPKAGHRIVEIGCVELLNHMPTGQNFQRYINPERDMPSDAEAVHGISGSFLADKPIFAEIAADLLEFLGDATLVIHNAEFDMKFLNAELARVGFPALPMSRAIDTVIMARRKFPGAQASLDALCRRFEIDNSHREKHGALLDSELLAEVYLQLIGGRQPGLELAAEKKKNPNGGNVALVRRAREPRQHAPSPEEETAHAVFLEQKVKNAIWKR
jgi:DNA polymerase-3 subunit epsilon